MKKGTVVHLSEKARINFSHRGTEKGQGLSEYISEFLEEFAKSNPVKLQIQSSTHPKK